MSLALGNALITFMKFLFRGTSPHLFFLWPLAPSTVRSSCKALDRVRWCHVVRSKSRGALDALEELLRRAHALTPDLISHVIVNACTRLPVALLRT
jgi:hypothetical protein